MIYVLDTDHVSILQRGGPASIVLTDRLSSLSADDLGTTIVTYEEQCKGLADAIHRPQNAHQRLHAYDQLSLNLSFFSNIAVWGYISKAEDCFSALLQAKVRVGTNDLKIASIALANKATVLTRNTRDFGKIPNLVFADWTT